MTTPPAAPTSEKTKLFIHEPRGTRVILNYINCRGNDLGCLLLNELLFICSMTLINHRISVPMGSSGLLVEAGNAGVEAAGSGFQSMLLYSAEFLVSRTPEKCPGRHRIHGKKPQDSTPGIFTVLRLAFSQLHGAANLHPTPQLYANEQNYGKTALIGCPSVLP